MDIQLIPYQQIDFERYNQAVKDSQFPIVYAMSWYLDVVTQKNWSLLVHGDYGYVMPVPYARLKRNFMMKSVVQPMFCQQLGIFSKENNAEIHSAFINQLKEQKRTVYHFNESLVGSFPFLSTRDNFILKLNQLYEEIYANYRKDRRKDIRRGEREKLEVTNILSVEEYFKGLLAHSNYLNKSTSKLLKQLLDELWGRDLIIGRKVLNPNGQWLAMAIWIKSFDRRILLSSVRHSQFGKRGVGTVLRNAFIREFVGQQLIFDFEGSMIPGVADFNASFGAERRQFPVLK
ncbi:hypothetical protein GO491_02235 [Flavobacteriaceae bacterium Ap0902]|nr:hypothetical protein [Flavobacteriaceae bacterium Ap0902]